MDTYLQKRTEEIKHYLDNEDLNRAGIRMLDLLYDFEYPPEIRKKAIEIRIRYNQVKELGKQKISDTDLIAQFHSFYRELTTISTSPYLTEKGLIGKATGISKEFKSRLRTFFLHPIDIELTRGNIIGVVGENGNGKTTLLRMLAGELASETGMIEYYFDGLPETDWTLNKLRIAFVPQRTERWFGQVYENLSFYAAIKGIKGAANREKTELVLHRMGLTTFAGHTWPQLSSGYRLRFEIAKALVWDPVVMILDEPLANLDMQSQQLMLDDLRNLADSLRNPVSIIMSSQQLHEVESVSDQIIFLKNGRAAFNGSLPDFRQQQTSRIFEIHGKFNLATLESIFSDWEDLKIEQTISAFIISCNSSYTLQDLLKRMTDNHLEIEYFRDITGSTKILFNDKY